MSKLTMTTFLTFLHVGLDLAKRRSFEAFLTEHGYTVAPVTIDSAAPPEIQLGFTWPFDPPSSPETI